MGTINEHVKKFAGLPVLEYDPEAGIKRPGSTCQRVANSYNYGDREGDLGFLDRLDRFLADKSVGKVKAIVFGPWWDELGDYADSGPIVERLVAARDRLASLTAVFLGDITYEENEITWIKQGDVTPLLEAFPALEHLRIRGCGAVYRGQGKRLQLRSLSHANLRTLTIESGCLPADIVRAVAGSDYPSLEHLELWLGDSSSSDCGDYGDTTVDDLRPIFQGDHLPALKSLALRNSRISDGIAAALANAPIMAQLEALDLSLGTLSDKGALSLLKSGALANLKALDIHHHYVTDEVLDGLKALGLKLDASDQQVPEDDDYDEDEEEDEDDDGRSRGRYISISE